MSAEAVTESAWAPLRIKVFRTLWFALLASNLGTWMQTVGAQWLLVDEPNASTLVALVQTATTLPILLLALPAGVLADSFDRRRLLIVVQAYLVVVGVALTALTVAGSMRPVLLLSFTFAIGCGMALTGPAWQALIPELVPRRQLPAAAALGSINMNLARAAGPAIAGLLVAQTGPAVVFGLNALSFGAFGLALLAWRPQDAGVELPEPFMDALLAGGRFVRYSPFIRRLLLRSALFVAPATAVWALLPLVASERLGLGAGGYGLLLGALGVGAVAGAVTLGPAHARLSTTQLLLASTIVFAVALAAVALVSQAAVVALLLVPAGAAWMTVLSSINASMQLFLPRWVRARGLSVSQLVLFGSQAAGALVWGLVAEQAGLVTTFLVAAGVMALGAATIRLWPLREMSDLSPDPVTYWPEPHLALDPDPDTGPVLVTVTYTVAPDNQPAFLEAMRRVRRSRLRTGAIRWGLYRQGEIADTFVELYLVRSWGEHLRQHEGRLTGVDQAFEREAQSLADGSTRVAHLLPAEPDDD